VDINRTNNECTYMGWISDRIFIWRTQGSGGLLTKYSFGVCQDLADYWPNIHLVYARIWRITDLIFIWCMQGSGGWPTEYSVGVCRDLADYWLNIHSVYTGFRWIANWIFSWCVLGSGGLLTRHSFGVCTGRLPIGYSSIVLGELELNIKLSE
jgi:hypothetical protein